MKDVVLKEIEKESGKVFTKERKNSRIKKNYNPLKVNYKIYKRGSGLNRMEEVVLEKNDLNLKEFMNIRILKNVNLFSEEEMLIIKNNSKLIQKVYMLGILDNV